MADMPVGGSPQGYGNNAGPNNGAPPRPSIPQPTGSPIRGPKQVMADRHAREEKKRLLAEQEKRAAEERAILEQRRISDERKAQGGDGNNITGGGGGGQRAVGQRTNDGGRVVTSGAQPGASGIGTGAIPQNPAASHAAQQRRAQRAAQNNTTASTPFGQSNVPSSEPQNVKATSNGRVSSFPHAFERWESLSSHWEGLTSYWIRKLEENQSALENDPISMHLSRQVTDLTAAGANLFHAVVELQRLRASSERKFQRWFFDTRKEMEQMRELEGQLRRAAGEGKDLSAVLQRQKDLLERRLDELRHEHEILLQKLEKGDYPHKETESHSAKDKIIAELKRELEISKSEARRAWEELGRREQEERDRTAALREGMPTLIGGVQVVPMLPGQPPSRHISAAQRERPATRDGTYPGGPTSGMMGGMEEDARQQADPFTSQPATYQPNTSTALPIRGPRSGSITPPDNRPLPVPSTKPTGTSAGYYEPTATSTASPYYNNPATAPGHDGDDEYEIDERGNYILDANGRKIPYRSRTPSAVSEDEYVSHPSQQYGGGVGGRAPAVSGPGVSSAGTATQQAQADYTGQSYGSGDGWEAITRHQHPTRLSDVIEEDERSRTSASQVSRRD